MIKLLYLIIIEIGIKMDKKFGTCNVNKPKKTLILYILVSMFMVFFSITGTILNNKGNLIWDGATTAKIVGASIVGGVVVGLAVAFGIYYANCLITWLGQKLVLNNDKIKPIFKKPIFIGGVSAVVILICYIPIFLAYYPGICSYDSGIQATQYFSGDYYEHHPLAHTLLIAGCLKVGYAVFGNYNAGIALYAFSQMLVFVLVFAFGIALVFKWVYKKSLVWAYIFSGILTLFCGLFDFTKYMAITVTKDCLFAIFFLLQFLLFTCVCENKNSSKKKTVGLLIAYAVALVLCGIFRNNATYALIIAAMVEVAVALIKWIGYAIGKKKAKSLVKPVFETVLPIATMAAVIVTMLILSIMGKVLNATPGDKREMLSIPIQQMARTAVYHSGRDVVPEDDGTLDDRTMAVIDEFFLYDSFPLYRQEISDPVKRYTNTYVARYKTKEFLYAYTTMLKNHPGDYINAFVAVENGFINVNDYSHATINQGEGVFGLGYVQTKWDSFFDVVGIYKDSKIPGLFEYLENWANENKYLNYPIIKYIYMPGAYLYIFLYAFITLLKDKKKKTACEMVFVLMYFASCLFGPTVQMRYVYPFMILAPFMTIFCASAENKAKSEQAAGK